MNYKDVKDDCVGSLDQLIDKTVLFICAWKTFTLPAAMSEFEYLNHIRSIGSKNKMYRSFIGQAIMAWPHCLLLSAMFWRTLSWYTSYTPYQAEISQEGLKLFSIFRLWLLSLPEWRLQMPRFLTNRLQQQRQ